jgi:hypothetical protein
LRQLAANCNNTPKKKIPDVVLPIVVKVVVKEVNINGKVGRVIVIEVGGALALIVATLIVNITAPYCTRLRTTRFYTTKLYTTRKAIGKGIVVYRRDYILSGFN